MPGATDSVHVGDARHANSFFDEQDKTDRYNELVDVREVAEDSAFDTEWCKSDILDLTGEVESYFGFTGSSLICVPASTPRAHNDIMAWSSTLSGGSSLALISHETLVGTCSGAAAAAAAASCTGGEVGFTLGTLEVCSNARRTNSVSNGLA